jgi:hypothetical protein
MTDAVVRLWLKVGDPTALTARETLQRALTYGRRVEEVSRSELWCFRWETEPDPRGVLARLARDTNLILNPNKHLMEVAVGDEALHPRGNAWVMVSVPGEGDELEETLRRHRLVEGPPPATRRAILWELSLGVEGDEAAALAAEIAVARERKRGLLTNPHLEDAMVFRAPPRALEIARVLMGTTDPERVG